MTPAFSSIWSFLVRHFQVLQLQHAVVNCLHGRYCDQVSEMLAATEGGEEVLIVEQTEEELIADDNEMTDDLMPRSSPDGGSTNTDVDDEQHGSLLHTTV